MADATGDVLDCEFLELIAANERIGRLLDMLRNQHATPRRKHAVSQLLQEVQTVKGSSEEAVRQGAPRVLTQLLGETDDDDMLDSMSRILAICSGQMACCGKVSAFCYGSGPRLLIQEGALSDGLGTRVWGMAHVLCRELVQHPQLVAARRVLEIGSGTGVCGVLAARLGAAKVVMTDNEATVLDLLRANMHLNSVPAVSSQVGEADAACDALGSMCEAAIPGGCKAAQRPAGNGQVCRVADASVNGAAGCIGLDGVFVSDAELFSDAESVGDDAELLAVAVAGDGAGSGGGEASSAWEAGAMEVRFLDWVESLRLGDSSAGPVGAAGPAAHRAGTACEGGGTAAAPPHVPLGERFGVVLGCETMYEATHALLVAAVLAHRLAPGGAALLCSAVRDVAVFTRFAAACASRGLRYRARQVVPLSSDWDSGVSGVQGRDYEGGFLMMAVDHADAPCTWWHRSDWDAAPGYQSASLHDSTATQSCS